MTLSDENVRDRLERLDKLLGQLCEPWHADLQWSIELAVSSFRETPALDLYEALYRRVLAAPRHEQNP